MGKLKWLDDDGKDNSLQEQAEEREAFYKRIDDKMNNVPDEVIKAFCKPWDRFITESRKSIPDGFIDKNDKRRMYNDFFLYLTIFIRMMQDNNETGTGVWARFQGIEKG